jgi:hypothetical protein
MAPGGLAVDTRNRVNMGRASSFIQLLLNALNVGIKSQIQACEHVK